MCLVLLQKLFFSQQHGIYVALINCSFISLFFKKTLVHSVNGTESSAASTQHLLNSTC